MDQSRSSTVLIGQSCQDFKGLNREEFVPVIQRYMETLSLFGLEVTLSFEVYYKNVSEGVTVAWWLALVVSQREVLGSIIGYQILG